MTDIINGNVFLVGGNGFGNPPLIFSSFIKAEGELLGQIRKAASKGQAFGFVYNITCVQIDTNATRKVVYTGSITPSKHKTTLHIVRDEENRCGYKAKFTEKLLLSLDHVKMSEGIHELCKRCKNFIKDAELSYDCYSKKCPSTNKTLKIDGRGPNITRKPTWDPNVV